MNDFMICPFCHSPVSVVKFDGGWKCECVRCEYTGRDGETMQEAIEFHQELAGMEEKNASLRALVGEMLAHIEGMYQCTSQCGHCHNRPEACDFKARRSLIAKAREVCK